MNNLYIIYGFKNGIWYFLRYVIVNNIDFSDNIKKQIENTNYYEEVRMLKFDPESYGELYL